MMRETREASVFNDIIHTIQFCTKVRFLKKMDNMIIFHEFIILTTSPYSESPEHL